MRVKDVYSTDFATATPESTIYDLIKISMEARTNGIFIVDKARHLLGLVTIFEILSAIVPQSLKQNPSLAKVTDEGLFLELVSKKKDTPAEKFMSKNPPKVYLETKLIEIAANSLQTEHYRLPVIDKNNVLIGVVNRTILREVIAKEFKLLP